MKSIFAPNRRVIFSPAYTAGVRPVGYLSYGAMERDSEQLLHKPLPGSNLGTR